MLAKAGGAGACGRLSHQLDPDCCMHAHGHASLVGVITAAAGDSVRTEPRYIA